MTRIAIFLLHWYQQTLSPDHGWFRSQHPYGFCRYYPTCSSYTIDALQRYGFFRGSALSLWRILRCNPLSRGGIDLISKQST